MVVMGKEEPLLGQWATPADCPDEVWSKMSIRERFRLYYKHGTSVNYTLPVFVVFTLYSVIGLVWYAGFRYLAMDVASPIFSPANARRFIVYNILHGISGLGATVGPLGVKNKVPFFACLLTFLTPGSLASPLLPGVVGLVQKVPARRGWAAVLTFALYYAALVRAMLDPSPERVTVAVGALALASVFDTVVFFASRGEHYGYHLICMMWPDWIAGCQWVQLMMYLWVGLSKTGPWFKYVIQVLMKDAIFTPFLPKNTLAKLFYKDWPRDFSPSMLPRALQCLGAGLEWIFPLCCTCAPGSTANAVGVWGMVAYHCFIWATLPMASVFEWQYYCVYVNMFFFGHNSFAMPTSPGLIGFLLVAMFILPCIGQIWPQLVPFLMAYRQYAGNWRLGCWAVRKDAVHKLKKIVSYNSFLFQEEAPPEMGGDRADYGLISTFLEVPQFRGTLSVFEKFIEHRNAGPDDFWFMTTFSACNAAFGWDLAVGWTTYRECVREALVELCGFEEGEMTWLLVQPSTLLPGQRLRYQVFDITKGPLDSDFWIEVAYRDLEGTEPCEVQLDWSKAKKGKCINGTFLGTYY